METQIAHLITGTRADVVQALSRMIIEENPDAGNVTFLELPERFDFRALAEKPIPQDSAPKTAEKAPKANDYEILKNVTASAMAEIGKKGVVRILNLFGLASVSQAEGNTALIRALTATLKVALVLGDDGEDAMIDGKEGAKSIYNGFLNVYAEELP